MYIYIRSVLKLFIANVYVTRVLVTGLDTHGRWTFAGNNATQIAPGYPAGTYSTPAIVVLAVADRAH